MSDVLLPRREVQKKKTIFYSPTKNQRYYGNSIRSSVAGHGVFLSSMPVSRCIHVTLFRIDNHVPIGSRGKQRKKNRNVQTISSIGRDPIDKENTKPFLTFVELGPHNGLATIVDTTPWFLVR